MKDERKFYVYCLFRPWNLEPCYIGKGFGKRMAMHRILGTKHYNGHLANIFKRAGSSEIPCVMLHDGLDEETAFQYEIAFIAALGRSDLGLGPLCNLSDGGEGPCTGRRHSDEVKKKIGDKHRGKIVSVESRAKMSASRMGIKMSAETRAKMSASRTGVKRSEEFGKAISDRLKGRRLSAETRAKIGAKSRGRKPSEETLRKISEASTRYHARRRAALAATKMTQGV